MAHVASRISRKQHSYQNNGIRRTNTTAMHHTLGVQCRCQDNTAPQLSTAAALPWIRVDTQQALSRHRRRRRTRSSGISDLARMASAANGGNTTKSRVTNARSIRKHLLAQRRLFSNECIVMVNETKRLQCSSEIYKLKCVTKASALTSDNNGHSERRSPNRREKRKHIWFDNYPIHLPADLCAMLKPCRFLKEVLAVLICQVSEEVQFVYEFSNHFWSVVSVEFARPL
jgi:hypothetical protein